MQRRQPIIRSGRELDWRDHANCIRLDPEQFHPEGKFPVGSIEYKAFVNKAISVCARCKVRDDCLDFGMTQPQGIYGGTTSSQRVALRRRRVINIINESREQ